jgi:hypothetical protein
LSTTKRLRAVEIEEVKDEPKPCRVPLGFKRIKKHPYLKKRHFRRKDFELYSIGTTDLDLKYKNRIIFLIEEFGVCYGFVGRSLEENPEKRYLMNKGAKISNFLFGYDKIAGKGVSTAILAEGIFDAIRINNFFEVSEGGEFFCLATFGKKISENQVRKLKKAGVENLFLAFDNDAVLEIKKTGAKLLSKFNKIMVVDFKGGKDASDCNDNELLEALESSVDFNHYFSQKVRRL